MNKKDIEKEQDEVELLLEKADKLLLKIATHNNPCGKVNIEDYVDKHMVRESRRRLYDDDEECNRTMGIV